MSEIPDADQLFKTTCPNCKAENIDPDMTQSLLKLTHKPGCRSTLMNVKTKYFIEEVTQ